MSQSEPKFASGDARTNKIPSPADPTEQTERMPGAMPAELGKYRVEKELGRGGMGVVYQAWDESLHRHVAIKLVNAALVENADFFNRFRQEARSVARLNHPNIVAVYEFVEQPPHPYLVMEFVDGSDMASVLRDSGPMSPERAVALTRQAALALQQAASVNLIHRDIKPANILVTRDGMAKVMDFGLSKRVDATDASLTASGAIIGTPHYMSPEQARGEHLDLRTDIYSLGCTMFSLLTARKPHDADTLTGVLIKQVNEPLTIPREWHRLYGGRLVALINRMTAKDRNARFATWGSVVAELEGMIAAGPRAAMLPTGGGPRLNIPWGKVAIGAGVVVVGGLAVAIGSTLMSSSPAPRPVSSTSSVSSPKASAPVSTQPAAIVAAPTPAMASGPNPFNETDPAAAPEPADPGIQPGEGGRPGMRREIIDAAMEGRYDEALARVGEELAREQRPVPRMGLETLRGMLTRVREVDGKAAEMAGGPNSTREQRAAAIDQSVRNDIASGIQPGQQQWTKLEYLFFQRSPEAGRYYNEFQARDPNFGQHPIQRAAARLIQLIANPPPPPNENGQPGAEGQGNPPPRGPGGPGGQQPPRRFRRPGMQ